MFFVTGLVATELVYTIAVASVGVNDSTAAPSTCGVVGDLGLLVRGDDRVDVLRYSSRSRHRDTWRPAPASVHVVGRVGPQRGDRVGRGLGDVEFGVDQRPVGEVGLHRRTREGGGARRRGRLRRTAATLSARPAGRCGTRTGASCGSASASAASCRSPPFGYGRTVGSSDSASPSVGTETVFGVQALSASTAQPPFAGRLPA